MWEGDYDFGEERLVEEGLEIAGDGAVGNNTVDDDHQVFDKKPVRHRHFYFVKILPFENPNTDAMIQKAEETIRKMNQDQILIAQRIRERMMDRDQLRSKLHMIKYYDDTQLTLKWHEEKSNVLHLSLDKLTFANNAYKGKPIISCLSAGEVDKQKLSFLMGHGCKNMADERTLLREVNASRREDGGMTLNELRAPIENLRWKMYRSYRGCTKTETDVAHEEAILKEIKQHEISCEKIIANAAVNGKLWNSLGSKKAMQAEVPSLRIEELRARQNEVRAKIRKAKRELDVVEREINSLQRRFTDSNCKKDEAYSTILKLKKQYGEEKNACYYQYSSLMKKVQMLAGKKDSAALQELSQEQVENFMYQWNNCSNFRTDYKKRITPSLNRQHLGSDGRMIVTAGEKPKVEKASKAIKPEALSKTRLKWLMKDAEDPSEILSL